MLKPFIGISGKGCSGKDSAADYLITKGWKEKKSFAHNLKNFCSKFFNIDISYFLDQDKKKEEFIEPIVINRVLFGKLVYDFIGISFLPPPKFLEIGVNTPRELLQVVGTDILRATDPDCHVLFFKKETPDIGGVIITDVRFPNEAEFVLESGGILLRINRSPEFTIKSDHPSEIALDSWKEWSYIIDSGDGGLDSLYKDLDRIFSLEV